MSTLPVSAFPVPRVRSSRALALLAAGALFAAGCGDGPSADELLAGDSTTTTTTTAATATTASTTTSSTSQPPTTQPPTTVAPTTEAPTTTAATATTSLPPTTTGGPVDPAGLVIVDQLATDGFALAVGSTYTVLDLDADLGEQAAALGLDAVGTAAVQSFESSRNLGDFRLAGFRFDSTSDHTDNVLVVRYPNPGDATSPALLEAQYAKGFTDPGGEVFSSEITDLSGRPAVVMEGERPVVGTTVVNRQFVALVFGDAEVWEIVVTIGLPERPGAFDEARAMVRSFTLP